MTREGAATGAAEGAPAAAGNAPPVLRRHVFYLSGFDPRGAAFYHRMYRDEAEKHSALSGAALDVGPRRALGPHVQSWTVTSETAGATVETRYDFLRWDDIVREHWPRARLAVWRDTLWAFLIFLRTGILRTVFRTTYPVFVTCTLPAAVIAPQILLTLAAAGAAMALAGLVTGRPIAIGLPAALLAGAAAFRLTLRIEKAANADWLGRIYAFTVKDARRQVAGLDARRDHFAALIAQAVREGGAQEILVVGHSLGTPLAISVMARALARDPQLDRRGPAVALLTLGQTTPILSLMPEADWFREEVRALARSDLDWIDFSAPPDGACFALVDPVRIFDPQAPRPDGEARPKLLNARFMDLIEATTYRRVKRDWMRVHFQYLMAGDRLAAYDYFAITTGPLLLAERYAERRSVTDYSGLRPFRR